MSPHLPVSLRAAAGVLLVVIRPAAAQQTRSLVEPPEFALDQWTTQDGLPQNSVTAIAQTPDGYLWVGTFGGLARFDGTRFRLVERTDSGGRHVDRIRALAVGQDSVLWVGTENGLLRYKDGYRVYTTAHGLPDNEVRSLHVDRGGALWIALERGGIARLRDERFEVFREIDGVAFDAPADIREDHRGRLWLKAGDRFVLIESGDPPAIRWRAPPAVGLLRLELHDRTDTYWFSQRSGLVRVVEGAVRRYGRDDGVPGPSVMVEDPGGGYWLGTHLDGLFFFQPDRKGRLVRQYPLPDGRAKYNVRSVLVDVDGNVWFGTDADGLLRAKRNLFTTYTSAHGLSHDVATAVYADAGGTVWVGTNCFGVNAIDPLRRGVRLFKPRRPGDPEGDPCVFALTEGPHGTMWAGTWGGGLTRLIAGREERLKHTAGLRDSVVLALFTDGDGTIWVGTNRGGLAALRGGRVRAAYTTDDGLAHNSVRSIYQTRDGSLWVGMLEGLSRFSEGRFTTYRARDGLSAQHVRAIHEDADGNLWIGTYGGGLNRLRDGVFTAITQRDGLAEDVVSTVFEDDRGYFWMSGNRGVSRVARSELIAFSEGRVRRVHSILYGPGDGLRNAETNGGFQPAGAKDGRGHLWFPTVHGVAVVDPARVSVRERPPRVAVQEVVVNGVPRSAAEALVLGPGRPNLEFHYTGLSLSAPQHLTFQHRLVGFDDDWVAAGARRVAYYPRLPPGQYRFVVTAANRDGVWNEAGTELLLRVAAPVWNAWWFRLTVMAVLLGTVAAVLRRRDIIAGRRRVAQEEFSRRLIESQEHERKRIAGELHDGLGQELLVVKNRALLALASDGAPVPVREQLQHITEIVAQSLESVRGLAHKLTPYQLEHLGLSVALRTMIEDAAAAVGVALKASVEDIDGLLPLESQIALYRIVQEALSNVVRHSNASTAIVHVRRAGDTIALTIRDDGRGFPVRRDGAGRLAGGFGLSGIAERVRILGGDVEVVSAPGQGTRMEVSVPVAHPHTAPAAISTTERGP